VTEVVHKVNEFRFQLINISMRWSHVRLLPDCILNVSFTAHHIDGFIFCSHDSESFCLTVKAVVFLEIRTACLPCVFEMTQDLWNEHASF
jgi:hypothetical protein